MISVVVRAESGAEALAATLRALVPAVAEGLVADAAVLVRKADEGIAAVADAVGATLVVDTTLSWDGGARAVRRDWILCLSAGDVPGEGWILAVDRFIALSPMDRGFGRLARRQTLPDRLRGLAGGRQVRAGDLLRRELLLANGVRRPRPARIAAVVDRDRALG
jgi:hypothetical protein